MADIFLNNVKLHMGNMGHSCPGPDDFTSMSCVGFTPPVKVIRKYGAHSLVPTLR
jgi:hypothetical protein